MKLSKSRVYVDRLNLQASANSNKKRKQDDS